MKTLIPTILVLAFMAALTSSLEFPSARQASRPAARVLAEKDVRDSSLDSVPHPFSHSPEALFPGEIEASLSVGPAIRLPLNPDLT